MLPALAEKSKTELLSYIERGKSRAKAIAQQAAKPVMQIGHGLAAVGGGAAGGVIAGVKPEVGRIPTDGIVGLVVAVPCLMGAGSPAVDAIAHAGYGMIAGTASRLTQRGVRNWREQRAADAGDAQAQQIVAQQKALDDARKARENPAKK